MRPLQDEPHFKRVGHVDGDHIIWDDGSPPTPLPSGERTYTKPAEAVCQSEEE